jgi:hypothetical protein
MLFILSRQEIEKKHHSYQGVTKWCKSAQEREFNKNIDIKFNAHDAFLE